MRISDWISDVCSSDLNVIAGWVEAALGYPRPTLRWPGGVVLAQALVGSAPLALDPTYVQREIAVGRLKARRAGADSGHNIAFNARIWRLSRRWQSHHNPRQRNQNNSAAVAATNATPRTEEHTSEHQSLSSIPNADF